MDESRVCRRRESFVVEPGTIGFTTIAGYSVFDAFYMSLITITTFGYDPFATGGSDQLKKFEYVLEGGK